MPCGPKYPTFFGPEFSGHRLRDFHTFCPKYNTKNEDDQNEDDQESLIKLHTLYCMKDRYFVKTHEHYKSITRSSYKLG